MSPVKQQASTKKIDKKVEWAKCYHSPHYFIHEYVKIKSAVEKSWIPFRLWPSQFQALDDIINNRLMVILKARQLGFTWLSLGYILHSMIFDKEPTIGLFSKGDREAQELLARLKDMYKRLPKFLKASRVMKSNAHVFELSVGSIAYALPTTGGESWTFTTVLCDEFDRFDAAEVLMINVKPTVDAGGQMIIGSISDKRKPNSTFKNIFRSAAAGDNEWKPLFMPWSARPDRNQEWYDNIVADAISRHGDINAAMDEIYQQYPATPEEALSPRQQNKRVPFTLLKEIYFPTDPVVTTDAPVIPTLRVWAEPLPGHAYVIGADPAEGVGGDDSSATVLDINTGDQVASFSGQFEPKKIFPGFLFQLSTYYNSAGIMVERNNHGHAVIGELTELIAQSIMCMTKLLTYPFDKKPGWLSSPTGRTVTRGKVLMYDNGASQIQQREVTMRDNMTFTQLSSIDINTLRAPQGEHDDRADAFMLACCGRISSPEQTRFFYI